VKRFDLILQPLRVNVKLPVGIKPTRSQKLIAPHALNVFLAHFPSSTYLRRRRYSCTGACMAALKGLVFHYLGRILSSFFVARGCNTIDNPAVLSQALFFESHRVFEDAAAAFTSVFRSSSWGCIIWPKKWSCRSTQVLMPKTT